MSEASNKDSRPISFFQTQRIECPGLLSLAGEIDQKDGINRALSLTMLMEGDWRETKMVKGKKMTVHR